MGDKVERYYHPKATGQKPWFFQQVENLFNIILPPKDQLPFGVSVAFLVGVSEYQYLSPQLPFVKNDLRDMRDFLLNQGGFDSVYVAAERVVNRDLIDDYMRNRFAKKLDPRDRLLFYYAGHGDDAEGNTGYMQFAQAQKKNFVGPQVLAINVANEWSSESRLRHMLFIFDCCSSGLGFTPRGDFSSLEVLSHDPCRIALTAGTADQQTFEVDGNGVFTRAFLNAAKTGTADKGNNGFMTVEEIFAYIKDEVAGFSARFGKPLNPQPWQLLDRAKYRGTFVFVNPEAKSRNFTLSEKYAQALNAQPRGGEPVAAVGIVQLTSYLTGQVYLDNTYMGDVQSGDVHDDFDKEVNNLQGKGVPNDFEVQQGDKVVLDRTTGLMWQQSGWSEYMTYEQAKAYVAQLNKDRFVGFSNWRLPTLEEAMSLMEPQKNSDGLYIDPKFDKRQNCIWTADKYKDTAWVVFFNYGYTTIIGVGGRNFVRAVRSGE